MNVTLNGKASELREGLTLLELLEELKLEPRLVACEINETIVKRSEYPRTNVREGDRVEILQMIGGG
ncbi:MAG: thiamine biosynthesis protein ThiS [Elusimicrobia bacterium RIFCSPLOWO2_01_FULL_64_13]|nr:MAG: thiamine biosynthesis protein ThiS [Elusimicrobia bacterium RIFCSPHIGHO2_01_FULL_64_10]OGR98008.1 MAG: thiamine biosynthesis protein ThiS [Elusimicrobia bacterium RIFCSPLOWO2_01_FULL_64_13]